MFWLQCAPPANQYAPSDTVIRHLADKQTCGQVSLCAVAPIATRIWHLQTFIQQTSSHSVEVNGSWLWWSIPHYPATRIRSI